MKQAKSAGLAWLFAVTIFLSAFLLFQVQPIIGKFILPWFGFTPGTWTTALMFFQLSLLGGYVYAHLVVSYLAWRQQAVYTSVCPNPLLPRRTHLVGYPLDSLQCLYAQSVSLPWNLSRFGKILHY